LSRDIRTDRRAVARDASSRVTEVAPVPSTTLQIEGLHELLARATSRAAAAAILQDAGGTSPDISRARFVVMLLLAVRQHIGDPMFQIPLLNHLQDVFASTDGPERVFLPFSDEHSARRARLELRRFAEQQGAKRLVALKAASALGELTNNVLLYASVGAVEIASVPNPRGIVVEVCDVGPGIPRVEDVLAGRYENQAGRARGLVTVRQVADAFCIDTGPDGTRVQFEMRL
jgi:anti-sigma regulatory factor (Ser/Thr protein kinase)